MANQFSIQGRGKNGKTSLLWVEQPDEVVVVGVGGGVVVRVVVRHRRRGRRRGLRDVEAWAEEIISIFALFSFLLLYRHYRYRLKGFSSVA